MMKRGRAESAKIAVRVLIVLLPALAYEWATRTGRLDAFTFVPLTGIADRMGELVADGEFLSEALLPSLLNIVLAVTIAGILGITFGALLWRSDALYRAVHPYLLLYYAIPTFALYPLFIVLFGVGRTAVVSLAVLFAVVIVVANTALGLRGTRRVWIKVGQSFNLSARQMFAHIYMRAAWPHIFTGLRLALSYSVIAVIATEFILATSGLGHEIAFSYNNFDVRTMYGAIGLVVVAVVLMNMALSYVQGKVNRRALEDA